MPVTPPTNLDPNAAPWGRWATSKIESIDDAVKRSNLEQINNSKQLNSSINVLNLQITELRKQQALLEQQQALLEAQQAALQAQQATLQAQQATLTTAVGNIASQQTQINSAISDLQNQQAYLNSLRPVTAASSVALTTISGWTNNGALRPSVSLTTTANGRVRISLSAAVAIAYGAYSVSGGFSYSRDNFGPSDTAGINTLFNGNQQGLAATKDWIVTFPANTNITVTAEFYGLTPSDSRVGYPSIFVQNVS